jgi:hypothetical protein
MTVPHGLLGKAYGVAGVAAAFIVAAIVVDVLGVLIFAAPDWVIELIFAGMVAAFIAFTIFIKWKQRARRY